MTTDTPAQIEALLAENRTYPPAKAFTEQANINDPKVYAEADADYLAFWEKAAENIDWFQRWDRVLDWDCPWAKWYVNAQLNASYNCLDRHLAKNGNKRALIWEGEPGDTRTLTYADMAREVQRFANGLKSIGVQKGDRVAIYMGMVPELPIAMLACARLGAPHSVVFGGFSPDSLADRINDAQAKVLITQDGSWRRGSIVPLKQNADAAVANTPSIEKVVVYQRVGEKANIQWNADRDIWWHDLVAGQSDQCPAEPVDSEHMLYILYTSGTTGKPKGIVHTTGGYMVGTNITSKWVFDLKDTDLYWCTADIGWVTGHSYVVYGPMSNGVTQLMYEGAPDTPDKDRFWDLIEKHGVTILYTAPTSIRQFMKWGTEYPEKHDLSSLRLLGTVGEPINPEAWVWYNEVIGHGKSPIVDTWWQTETGAIMITPLPGVTTTVPGSATVPFPGVFAQIVDDQGNAVPTGKASGYLTLTRPWPSMFRTIFNDPDRYVQTYWSKFPGKYFTGDGAKQLENGYYAIIGRVDDVLNVAGHRIGTWEVESALVDSGDVAEAAVVGLDDVIKGQSIAAFVTLKPGVEADEQERTKLKQHVVKKIGAIARPEQIIFTADLPKTRSAKIMRRLLRDIAQGRVLGDTTTLADPAVVNELKQKYESMGATE
ncbi:MAG TPA: acetate--CoA ligase [Chloroflexota bacterium]|nr:acetate--CoA ligase [Chloroflexota bacterium]